MRNSSSKGTALITGASRGIGALYADRLAKRGYDLILVARSEAPLQALAATLSRSTGRRTTPIVADVNNKQDLARVEAKLKDDPSITMLVNNAGCASVAPLLDADIEKMEDMIALNINALTRLTFVAAPAFVKRGAGTIINIGSAAGISVEALNGVYGASKAYVLAFSLSLQHELTSKGIRVQVVLPGRTATDGWDVAGIPWQQQPASIIMPVEDMVDAALAGLDHAIETIYAKRHHSLSDALGAKAISLLVEHLKPSIETSTAKQLAHRGECQFAAWFSIFGSMNTRLGISHLLGHQIGPRWKFAHGITSGITLS